MDAELIYLINCDLCKKILNDPRYLPCLHTFCLSCLNDNSKETTRSDQSNTFYCPKCSRVAKLRSNVSSSKLQDNLPKNKLASNVIEGYKLKSGKVICKPCDRKRKSTEATLWCIKCKEPLCDQCKESHGSFKTTMGHEITSITNVQSRAFKDLLVSPPCKEHKEDLDNYCYDDKVFICDMCKANSHRSCKSVFPGSVYAQKVREESKSVADSLNQHEHNSKIILENRMKEKEALDVSKVKITEQITAVRKKVNDLLTKYEKQCLMELEDIYSKEKQVLETDVLGVQGIYNAAQNMNNTLKAASKYAHDIYFVEWCGKIDAEAKMLNYLIFDIHESLTSSRLTFNLNPDLEKVMQTLQNLGGFTMKKEKVNLISGLGKSSEIVPKDKGDQLDTVSMLSYQLPQQQYNVRTRSDEHACYVTGMSVLNNQFLVCADKNNCKLKIFDTMFQLKFEHELEFAPFDVVTVAANTFAATVPAQSLISIFRVDSSVSEKRSLATNEACYGLAYSNKRFAFTCPMSKPTSVKMITNKGQEIMTICPEENYQSVFLRPWYVKFDTSGSHLYVSDSSRAHIYCCVGASLRKFAYTHERLNAPRGLTVRQNDAFFVVGWGSDNIHFVDRNGEFIKEVVNRWNGSFSPQTVCLSDKEDSIIVSLDPTSCNSDVLLVFDLPADRFLTK